MVKLCGKIGAIRGLRLALLVSVIGNRVRFTGNRHYCDKPLAFSQNTPDFSDLLSWAFGRKAAVYIKNKAKIVPFSLYLRMSVLFGIKCRTARIFLFFRRSHKMKITKKAIALLITIAMLCATMSIAAAADADSTITVHFSLLGDDAHGENEHTEYDYWISYQEYTLQSGSTALDLFKAAMDDFGYTYDDSNGYISSIEDLAELTNGPRSGWMYRINGKFTDAMDKVTLCDGDRMLFFYTDDYNTINWSGVPSGVNDVIAQIDAIGTVTEQSGAAIENAAGAYNKLSDEDKLLVENLDVLEAAQMKYNYIIEQRDLLGAIDNALDKTAEYLINSASFDIGAIGGDWTVFGLARAGLLDNAHKAKYAANVKNALDTVGSETLNGNKSTENSRVVLALTAAGFNAADFAGYDLTKPLCDYDYVVKQGVNGAVFALLALDSANYAENDGEIRQKYVDYIISQQQENGGYSYDGETVDIDLTAMVISALAKYTNDEDVAMNVFSLYLTVFKQQLDNGGFKAYGSECSESTAQVIVLLSGAQTDGAQSNGDLDDIYIKNANFQMLKKPINAMMKFYNENGGFGHDSTSVNMLSTEQCFYALTAAKRSLDGENPLYDMSDVKLYEYIAEDVTTVADTTADKPAATSGNNAANGNTSSTADNSSNGTNGTNGANGAGDNSAPSDDPDTGAMGGMGIAFAAITAAAAALIIAKKRSR